MTAPDGLIRIPLNEEAKQGGGQIEEFLMQFNGEGIQHIALLCDDLYTSIDALQMAGVPVLKAPNDAYYEMLEQRLPGHGEPVKESDARHPARRQHRRRRAVPSRRAPAGGRRRRRLGGLIGGHKRLLLQIFSETLLGPVFFEFIQRKGDEGFGEGNFKALFESLERDQMRRGALVTES